MGLEADELRRHVDEQADFLRVSARLFDEGRFAESKRLAVTLRVLLHDTRTSHSLLGQLIDLPTTQFPCVSTHIVDPDSILDTGDMFTMRIGPGFPLQARTTISARHATFPVWWGSVCMKSKEITASRRSAVLALSNQGGGAHVDGNEDTYYRRIVEKRAIGWEQRGPNDDDWTNDVPLNNPLPYIVRATTAEVLDLLEHAVL